MKSFSNNIRCC